MFVYYNHAVDLGIEYPWYGESFFDLCVWRDENNGLIGRVTTELALVGIVLIATIHAIVLIPFLQIAEKFAPQFILAVCTALFGIEALVVNPFGKNITSSLVAFENRVTGWEQHKIDGNQTTKCLSSRVFGSPKLHPFFELNDYEKSYLELKTLSHWLGLKGKIEVHGASLNLGGSSGNWMFDSLATAFGKFQESDDFKHLKLGSAKAAILQEALSSAYSEKSSKKIVAQIQDGKLTFIRAGWGTHDTTLAFYGDYMAVGNRGEGSLPEYSTLEVYKIDRALFTSEILSEIFALRGKEVETARPYFYETLPAKLSPTGKIEKDALCKEFGTIAPELSKGPHCTLASKKSVLRFAWGMLLGNLPQARLESKIFTDWSALHYKDITPETLSAVKEKEILESLARSAAKRKWERLQYNRWKAGYGSLTNYFLSLTSRSATISLK